EADASVLVADSLVEGLSSLRDEMHKCKNAGMQKSTDRCAAPVRTFAFLHFCILAFSLSVSAQTRLAVLQAEDRRAPTPGDVAILRSGSRSGDIQTARAAARALGRLERPSLIPDIVALLRHPMSEVRAEAADAVGQAAQGWKREKPTNAAVDQA